MLPFLCGNHPSFHPQTSVLVCYTEQSCVKFFLREMKDEALGHIVEANHQLQNLRGAGEGVVGDSGLSSDSEAEILSEKNGLL